MNQRQRIQAMERLLDNINRRLKRGLAPKERDVRELRRHHVEAMGDGHMMAETIARHALAAACQQAVS